MKNRISSLIAIICLFSTTAFAQPANDECVTAQNIGTLPAPAACAGAAPQMGAQLNIPGTLVAATPASPYIYQPGCSGAGGPAMGVPANDVWYSFTASSYQAVITINSTFANPNVAMYSGTCGTFGTGVGGCAVGTGGTVTLTVEQMVIGQTYYVQVSGNTGQTGTFNMIIQNNRDCADCMNASTLTVSPLPVGGTYSAGQTVTFCYHVAQYTQINTNWLHGVQLAFGAGWNPATLTTVPPPACQGTGYWAYYPAGTTSTATGTVWPAGFYFETIAGQNNPGNNFGDNCAGVQPAGTWNFCFSITTDAACTPGSNLSVTINTSGDGESGSWSSLGCLDDPATVFNAVGACCPPNMASTNATCAGNDGTATATPVGGASPYDYTWTNSGGTVVSTSSGVVGANTATGLAPGTYTVAVVDNNGCLSTNTVTVGGGGAIGVPTAGSNSPVCVGGTLNLTAAPIGGATYAWAGPNSFSSAIQNPSIVGVTPAAAGTYTVTATVAGCTNTSTTVVVINPNPTVNVPPDATYCNGDAVAATNFTSTPVGATYTWTNSNTAIGLAASGSGNVPAFGATNATAGPITATITVTPTLAGCVGTPDTYTITVNPTPTVTVPANSAVCSGDNIPASAFVSTPAGGTFTWTNSDPTIGLAASGSGNTPAFVANNSGTAPVTATITVTPTVNGCVGTPNNYTITVNPIPTVTVPADITVCNGVNVPASNYTSPTAGTTFTWTNSNPAIGLGASGSGNTPAFNATNGTASPISAVITVTPTANGCLGTPSTYNITVNSNLIVNAGPDDTICFAGNTILNATPSTAGNTYLWSPAGGLSNTNTFNPTASPAVTTTYNVVITDVNGCTGTDDVTIFADSQIDLTAIVGFNSTCNGACDGQTIVIPAGGTPTYSYLWSSGCTAASCNALCPGTYSLTVTDAWGCTATSSVATSEPPLLVASITGTTPTSCNAICDGTATGNAVGGTVAGAYQFSWNTIPVQNTAMATGLCAGSYILTVTDDNGCSDTVHATIIEPSAVTNAPIPAVTICIGGNTTLTVNAGGGAGGYVYTWDEPGTPGFANTASVTVSPATTTTYTVHVVDANGCVGPDVMVTVTVNPPLSVIAAGTTSICPGGTANISAIAAGGSGGPYTYTWGPIGTGVGSPVTVSPAVTTTYTVVATDGCGSPPAIDSVTITVLPVPTVLFYSDDSTGCAPLCVNFFDNSNVAGGAIVAWNWDLGDGTSSSIQNPQHCYGTPGVYSITLTATSNSGCVSTYTSVNMISVYANPVAAFYTTPQPTSILDPEITFHDQSSSDVVSWFWEFGDGTSLGYGTPNPVHLYPDIPYVYTAELTVINANGCIDTVVNLVLIDPEFTFFIPNAFTPNGDGVNDEFFGTGVGIDTYDLFIFDRWGNLIFYSDDLNKKWDGKANHGREMAQQDVYVWKVKLTDVFGRKHNYIGTVTIVK